MLSSSNRPSGIGTPHSPSTVTGGSSPCTSAQQPKDGLADKAGVAPESRLKAWATQFGGFFGTPPDRSADTSAPASTRWRPVDPAFQLFHELVDGVGHAAEGDRPAIATAIATRLRRAGLMLPAARHSPAVTVNALLSPGWMDVLDRGRLDLADLLGALRRSEDVEPGLRRELGQRLMVAFETMVNHVAETHAGIDALRRSCTGALRPLAHGQPRPSDPGARMRAFSADTLRLVRNPENTNAAPGQLASRLFDCLKQGRDLAPGEHAALAGQIAPAIESVIHADLVARAMAGTLRQAAHRLESYLQVSACMDLADPDSRQEGATGLGAMPKKDLRTHLLAGLLKSSLDAEVLDDMLEWKALGRWVHPTVMALAQGHPDGRIALEVLRQTLRPLLDTGLIDTSQRHQLMQQLEDHLLPPAAHRGTESPQATISD